MAGNVADDPGSIGAVQAQYAKDDGFEGADPTKNVALVENASGGDLTPADAAAGNTSPSCLSSSGTGTPEVPYAVALPVLALAAFGGVLVIRRRRDLSVAR